MEEVLKLLNERVWKRKKYYGFFFLFISFIITAEKNFVGIPKKAILVVSIITFVILFLWSEKIEKNVLIITVSFGVLFSIMTPIYDVWDEPAHFTRVQYISEGHMFLTNNKEDHFTSKDVNKLDEMSKLPEFLVKKVDRMPNTLETKLWEYKHDRDTEYQNRVPVTNAYGTISYLPSALGYNIGKVVSNENLGVMFYLGRIFNVLFYSLCAYIAVKLARQWQYIIAFFAIQPMMIYASSSFNQDSFSYGLLLIIVSLFFRMIQNEDEKIDFKILLVYFLLCAVLAYTKLPYIALGGLPFFIPMKKYVNVNTYLSVYLGIIFVIITSVIWFVYYSKIEGLPPRAKNVDAIEQVNYILSNFKEFLSILFTNVYETINKYGQLATFAWDKKGSGTLALVNLISIGLIFGFPMKNIDKVSRWTKFGVVIITILISILIYLSMYLTWNDVGHPTILGVQGRYFVGIILLLPIILNFSKYFGEIKENHFTKNTPQFMCLILLIWSVASRIGVYY